MSEPYWEPFASRTPTVQGMVPIQRIVLTGAAPSFDFQNIPQYYHHLKLVIHARGDAAAVTMSVQARLNNDSGANYDWELNRASGSGTGPAGNLAQTSAYLANFAAGSAPAGTFDMAEVLIPNYISTLGHKNILSLFTDKRGVAAVADLTAGEAANWWRSTAAVNRVTVLASTGNFAAGSVCTLYGILDTALVDPATLTPLKNELTKLWDSGPLAAAAASITSGVLPQTHRDLLIVASIRNTSGGTNIYMRCNGDSGGNYDYAWLQGAGGAVTSSSLNGQNQFLAGKTAGTDSPVNVFGVSRLEIADYSVASRHHTMLGVTAGLFGTGGGGVIFVPSGCYRPAALTAITTITVLSAGGNCDVGSQLAIYGRGAP